MLIALCHKSASSAAGNRMDRLCGANTRTRDVFTSCLVLMSFRSIVDGEEIAAQGICSGNKREAIGEFNTMSN